MSYSPTVYCASTVTPSALSRRGAADAGAARSERADISSILRRSHGLLSKYSARRGALYASMRSKSCGSPTLICPRCRICGTGTTIANSF